MRKIWILFRQDRVLTIAAVAALFSMFFTPPSKAYLGYIDFSVLMLLFCFMTVVAGLKQTGVLSHLSCALLKHVTCARSLAAVLTGLCFITSMFITNDVALLTFVPLTLGLLHGEEERLTILTVVLQTIAANLGSLVTPIGNPQNLYLFTYYHMPITTFMQLTLPLGALCLLLLALGLLLIPRKPVHFEEESFALQALPPGTTLLFSLLFGMCLLTVVDILPHWLCFVLLLGCVLWTNPRLLQRIDYGLLLTFVCFFIFVGNLTQIPSLHALLSEYLAENVLLYSLLTSQIFSNVPTAVMLSGFTSQAEALVLGTNIGGLGTLVASLASLISYRLYSQSPSACRSRYLKIFTLLNVLFLLLLFPMGVFLLH